jgi:hypothetical protein
VNYTLLIVPALAAALVGSFLITGGACLLLGMARSELSFWRTVRGGLDSRIQACAMSFRSW